MTASTKKQLQSEGTRRKLIAVARDLFATRGYAGTSIGDITARARVTRGALYHHFSDKKALFQAVFEQVEEELVSRAAEAASESHPAKRLDAAVAAFLDACLDRDVQQIVLLDGFSVLGWETASQIDEAYALGSLQALLELAMSEGQIQKQPVEPLAQVLLGALNQAALTIARADDVPAARRKLGKTIERLLAGLSG
jgi:AcrR family transcriptional regulator